MRRSFLCILAGLYLLGAAAPAGAAPPVAERMRLYPHPAAGVELRSWGIRTEEKADRLLLNADHRATPWAGVSFTLPEGQEPLLAIGNSWRERGYVSFRINGLEDRYGQTTSPGELQVRLIGAADYHRLRARFYEGERGIDADRATWQRVLVPFQYLEVKPGAEVTGVSLQCVGRPAGTFAVTDLELVRFSRPLPRDEERWKMEVAQPGVKWPAYDELDARFRRPQNEPLLRDGRFVTPDGRRAFLIMNWSREDQALNLGLNREGKPPPAYGLYDPATQGFIYEQPLTEQSMSRLGFNCYSGQVNPAPFWRALGHEPPSGRFTQRDFLRHVGRMGYPFYVDLVCFPWTLGKTAAEGAVPPGALHDGNIHWTPYRIIGRGRDVWLKMWTTYARRYRRAGARVLFYELFNEPAYAATTPDHRAEFVDWLKRRHGSLAEVNRAWRTDYESWQEIREFEGLKESAGLFFDYDDYLGDRFADLVGAGQEAVDAITPGVPAAVQSMGGYCLRPRNAIHPWKFIPRQGAVLTPTGGGRWTEAVPNPRPRRRTMECGIGPSPLANDLLLTMAGDKMIVNNEMYLSDGQSRRAVVDRFWKDVLVGIDGSAWFSWSKRGWAWREGRRRILGEAAQFPYSNLIPFARRADALRGVLEFAREIELVRRYLLPKPWGPPPRVAMIYSWASARRRNWQRGLPQMAGKYHAAMRYLHWNFDVVPSHMAAPRRLAAYDLVVAGGIDHAEPDLLSPLLHYVKNGGVLIAGDGALGRDIYDNELDSAPLLGVHVGEARPLEGKRFAVQGLPPLSILPGALGETPALRELKLLAGTEALWSDRKGRPVVTRHGLGAGETYYLAADLRGYPLAKLLSLIRRRTIGPPALSITDPAGGQLVPNVLVSRRAHGSHRAVLLFNTDRFPKLLRVRLTDLDGKWFVSRPLEGQALAPPGGGEAWSAEEIADDGLTDWLRGGGRGLLLLTRDPWTESKLTPVGPRRMRAEYRKALNRWKARQGDKAFATGELGL